MNQFSAAISIAFERPRAYALALLGGAGMLLLLAWSSGLLTYYPTGWELYATPVELATLAVISTTFALLVPLQIAALAKARSAVGTAGGVAGSVFGILSMSCCAPLFVPAVLSFAGFSGTALLGFNAAIRELSLMLTAVSVMCMLVSIGLVTRTITAACRIPAPVSTSLASRPQAGSQD